MPELLEVESFRALAERGALGREIRAVNAPDSWYLKRGLQPALLEVLVGGRFIAARRLGKLLLLDTRLASGDTGPVLCLRFGLSGRLVVDGIPGVREPWYAFNGSLPRYERFGVDFVGGAHLGVRDPRRLGGVEVDPAESRIGFDAATVTLDQLVKALAASKAPLKSRLMDQAHIAGIGNLIADEVLWRAGIAPQRPAGGLSAAEVRRLHRHLRRALVEMAAKGGSHTGDLMPQRAPGGVCPRDGRPLRRDAVGGRTTWWCPNHQR